MKVTVLGCNGPYPAPGEATSGYLLEHEGHHILIDCGAGIAGKLQKLIPIDQLDCILFSHLHFDHMSDAFVLGYHAEIHGRKLPIYFPPEENSFLRDLAQLKYFEPHEHQDHYELFGISIDTMPVRHPVSCRALRFTFGDQCFVFTGDTNYVDTLPAFCARADLLLADSAFYDESWAEEKPHLSAGLCGKLAKEAGVKRLCLTHLNPDNDVQKLIAQAKVHFENTMAAKPGMELPL